MMSGMQTDSNMTFETAMARLEQILATLEAGDLPLEEALKLCAEGNKLVSFCSTLLDQAEARLEMLLAGEDGATEVVPAESLLGKGEGA